MGPLDNPAFQSRLRSLFASFATDSAHHRSLGLGASVLFALGDGGRAIDNRIEIDPAHLELSSMAGSALGRSAPLEQPDDERMTDPAAPWNWSVLWRAPPLAVRHRYRKIDPAAPLELSSMAGSALGRSAPLEQTDDERMSSRDPAAPWSGFA